MQVDFDIILRTCLNNSVQPWDRIIDLPKNIITLKCVKSLINSINNFDDSKVNMKLTVIDDHSSADNLTLLLDILNTCNRPVNVIELTDTGYNNSALEQFKLGHDNDSLVYMVEDDYFHAHNAIEEMFNAWWYFRSIKDPLYDIAIYPYDSTHLYWPDDNRPIEPALLYNFRNWYWRTTTKTSNTMLIHSNTIKKYWVLFEALATQFPNVTEDDTINRLYNNGVNAGGPVCLFSPVPSLAVHISYHKPTIMDQTFIDWVKCFNDLEL